MCSCLVGLARLNFHALGDHLILHGHFVADLDAALGGFVARKLPLVLALLHDDVTVVDFQDGTGDLIGLGSGSQDAAGRESQNDAEHEN